ncbi:MAG: LEA type 2 family protein [Bacteroidetes bacterium]|nr:LEA type 2 family protein [Bacteroidota bacterium]
MRKNIKYGVQFLLVFIIGSFMQSCKPIEPIVFKKLNEAKVKSISLDKGIDATINATIDNPNKMGVKIYGSALNVKINNIDLGLVKLDENIKIKAKGEHTIQFDIHGELPGISMGLLAQATQLAKSKDATVQVKGTITVGKFLFRRTIPVEVTSRVPIQK